MKQKLTTFSKVILLYFIIVFSSCETENIITDSPPQSISNAKSWFEDYKTKIVFDSQFSDINYHWELSYENILEDGSKAIVIPLTENHPNPEYKGEKFLYLYPLFKDMTL